MTPTGPLRATVASSAVEDPNGRFQVRVRIPLLHRPETPDNCLPVAEICAPLGRGRGSWFPYTTGDLVWVFLENNDPNRPIIIGGQITRAGGVLDVPIEQQVDPSDDVMVLGDGPNSVTLDGRLDRKRLRIRSGGAEVVLSAVNDSILIEAATGTVEVRAANANVSAGVVGVSAQTVNIDANGSNLIGNDSGQINERANNKISRVADPTIPAATLETAASGKLVDGGNVPQVNGVPLPVLPRQSNVHALRAKFINIGVGPTGFATDTLAGDGRLSPHVDYDPSPADVAASAAPSTPMPLLPTLEINIRASSQVAVVAPRVLIGGGTTVDVIAQADLNLTALRDATLSVAGNVTATVGGDARLTTGGNVWATIGGNAALTVSGACRVVGQDLYVKAHNTLSMLANTMELTAVSLSLSGNVRIDGSTYLTHVHGGVDAGGSQTLPPVVP